MLVKYRMVAGATLADMKADIHKIIAGQITTVADFSSSCDKTNTVIYGSYPTGVYTVENAGTYTYSKTHNQDSSYKHYFRLVWGATYLDQIILAQGYTSGTNTLVNSTTSSVWRYLFETGYSASNYTGSDSYSAGNYTIDGGKFLSIANSTAGTTAVGDNIRVQGDYVKIVDGEETAFQRIMRFERNAVISSIITAAVNNYTFCSMNWDPTVGIKATSIANNYTNFHVYRSGNINLTTATYTAPTYSTVDIVITGKGVFIGSTVHNVAIGVFDISKNGISREFTSSALMALIDVNNYNNGVQIPYFYNVITSSYGVVAGAGLVYETPSRIPRANTNLSIIENPVATSYRSAGFSISSIYGLYKIADGTYNNSSRYTDSGGTSRVVYNNFSIVTE